MITQTQTCDCQHCNGTGYSPAARLMRMFWFGHWDRFGNLLEVTDDFIASAVVELVTRMIMSRNTPIFIGNPIPGWNKHLNQEDVNFLLEKGFLDEVKLWAEYEGWEMTAENVNVHFLTNKTPFGLDVIAQSALIKYRLAKLDIDDTCVFCRGDGFVEIAT